MVINKYFSVFIWTQTKYFLTFSNQEWMMYSMEHENWHNNDILYHKTDTDATQQLVCNCPFLRIHSVFFISDHGKHQKIPRNLHDQKEKNIQCHHLWPSCSIVHKCAMFIKRNIFHDVECMIVHNVGFVGCIVEIHVCKRRFLMQLIYILLLIKASLYVSKVMGYPKKSFQHLTTFLCLLDEGIANTHMYARN